ncbi:MAG: leucine-rich repeat domain-containing protein [Treponema sp.]|nr:leucine-rich repeat domain-containing protein [Treponema sp.]
MRLGILPPASQGLSNDLAYLPALVQGVLVANISKYSAISVLDRLALDKVIDETQDLTYEDNAAIVSLGHVANVGCIMTGNIIRTSTGYNLQLNVTDTTDNAKTLAAYSGVCTTAEMDDQTAIQKASMDLLEQMGVKLSAKARNELARADTPETINAQTALAQGVTAQRQGLEVEALSFFIQASNYDPELAEADSRLKILTASMANSNNGTDARNDIALRRQWIQRLQETEAYYRDYTKGIQPYYLVYDTNIKQGDVNYQNETVSLSFGMSFVPDTMWVNTINGVIQTVEKGLIATGKAETWGLDWPDTSVSMNSPFTAKTNNLAVSAEIFNAQGRSIGKQTVTVPYGYFVRYGMTSPKQQWEGTVSFPAVDTKLITDQLTIKIVTIDGNPAEAVARQRSISITTAEEFGQKIRLSGSATDETLFTFKDNGTITGYIGTKTNVVIPSTIKGVLITEIGGGPSDDSPGAFGKKGLTNVTIPNSVRVIGDRAFMNNELASISIPNSVISIGLGAFANNKLTSVTIPNSITSISRSAFLNNQLTSVTIPNSITSIDYQAFRQNKLTNITIPDSVTSIGESAFQENSQLTSIIFPDSVKTIGRSAFFPTSFIAYDNNFNITSITIGADVTFGNDGTIGISASGKFEKFYEQNGKRAGTYRKNGDNWTFTAR